MSGTKFTTSIGSKAEQNSVRKTRQAQQQQQQQPEQEQEQNKGEENMCTMKYLSSCGLGLGSRFRAKQGKSLDDARIP
jgi:membrane protease subunit (stomatin/prohibitin family)